MTSDKIDQINEAHQKFNDARKEMMKLISNCDHWNDKLKKYTVNQDEMYLTICNICRRRLQWFDGRWNAIGESV